MTAALRRLLNDETNVFFVNVACHERIPPPAHFWELAIERHGEGEVTRWLERIQRYYKTPLVNGLGQNGN